MVWLWQHWWLPVTNYFVQVRKGVHLTLDIPLEGDSRQIIDYYITVQSCKACSWLFGTLLSPTHIIHQIYSDVSVWNKLVNLGSNEFCYFPDKRLCNFYVPEKCFKISIFLEFIWLNSYPALLQEKLNLVIIQSLFLKNWIANLNTDEPEVSTAS